MSGHGFKICCSAMNPQCFFKPTTSSINSNRWEVNKGESWQWNHEMVSHYKWTSFWTWNNEVQFFSRWTNQETWFQLHLMSRNYFGSAESEFCSITFGHCSFSYAAPSVWNSWPVMKLDTFSKPLSGPICLNPTTANYTFPSPPPPPTSAFLAPVIFFIHTSSSHLCFPGSCYLFHPHLLLPPLLSWLLLSFSSTPPPPTSAFLAPVIFFIHTSFSNLCIPGSCYLFHPHLLLQFSCPLSLVPSHFPPPLPDWCAPSYLYLFSHLCFPVFFTPIAPPPPIPLPYFPPQPLSQLICTCPSHLLLPVCFLALSPPPYLPQLICTIPPPPLAFSVLANYCSLLTAAPSPPFPPPPPPPPHWAGSQHPHFLPSLCFHNCYYLVIIRAWKVDVDLKNTWTSVWNLSPVGEEM